MSLDDEFCSDGDDDDYSFHVHKCNRQSIINEDEFHTPVGSPVRTPIKSMPRSPEILVTSVTRDECQVVESCDVDAVPTATECVSETKIEVEVVKHFENLTIAVSPSVATAATIEEDSDDDDVPGKPLTEIAARDCHVTDDRILQTKLHQRRRVI